MDFNLDTLAAKRKELKISQKEMNKLCQFKEKIYGLIERRKVEPKMEHIEAIKNALNKTTSTKLVKVRKKQQVKMLPNLTISRDLDE